MPSPAPRASRRAVLSGVAAVGALLLVGCGTETSDDAPVAGSADPTAPAVDADSRLVDEVGGQIAAVLALATATGTSYAGLRPLTKRLRALHGAHLDELGQDGDAEHGKVRGGAANARTALLRSEQRLQEQLVRAALDAESGALAQVFASMAAAIAQQRAVAA